MERWRSRFGVPSSMAEHEGSPGVAVVTGASSRIGRALARQFVSHGFDVLIAAEEPAIHVTADGLGGSGTCHAHAG
jgi:uncharacterized protein